MSYIEFRKALKSYKITILQITKILGISHSTPTVWRQKEEIPQYAKAWLELFQALPKDERVLYIHNKLKETEKQ